MNFLRPARPERPAIWTPARTVAVIAYFAASAIGLRDYGFPLDPTVIIGWIWLGQIAWNIERPLRNHLRFALDWAPIVALIYAYAFTRGAADEFSPPHIAAMIKADEALFGQLPTLWLQHRFYARHEIRWYDVAVSIVYFTHYIAALGVAAVLWVRRRSLWAAFMRRWVLLNVAGITTYFLFPAAPPWYAYKAGYIAQPVARISARGWQELGLARAGNLLSHGQTMVNPVAAMPSLHAGFAMLVVAFFLPMVRRRWWPVLLSYPMAMAVILVYTGEHYVIDALVGFAYVGATFAVVSFAERWWRRRRLTAEAEALLAAGSAEVHHADAGQLPSAAARDGVH